MKTTKSPRRVLEYAYLIGQLVLPDYSHRYSRHDFTQPQLFACLALKEFLQLDYRKLAGLLQDAGALASAIGLLKAPHFTTFQKAARRLLINHHAQAYLDKTIRLAQVQGRLSRRVSLAALDGTGLETRHASSYYVKRRANTGKYWQRTTYQRFPKAGVLCDTQTHLVLAVVPERGPAPDGPHFERALVEALARVRLAAVAADAGYDGEHHHRFAREQHGVRSLIPPLIGRPTKKPPSGYWRRQMKSRLHLTRYTQRWQVETVNSMLKRLLGSALRARHYWSQCREILLRAITLNIMILRRQQGFYRARMSRMALPEVVKSFGQAAFGFLSGDG
jgi:DDE family transposase